MDRLLKLAFLLQGTHGFYLEQLSTDQKIKFVKEVSHRFEELNIPEEEFGSSMYMLICDSVSDIVGTNIEKNFKFYDKVKIIITSGEDKGRTITLMGRLVGKNFLDVSGVVRDLSDVEFVIK